MKVDFGSFQSMAVCIPWGDVATAYRSTGIPNIEVYTAVNAKTLRWINISNNFNWLLRRRWLKSILFRRFKNFTGPSERRRSTAKSTLWGKATNAVGETAEARLEVSSGYTFTASSSVVIASHILRGNFRRGYQTPASAYKQTLVSEVDGTRWMEG
jgi:short subunit dehydrogenase-like uncharacterized protein